MSEDSEVKGILQQVRREGRNFLFEYEAKTVCLHHLIPTTNFRFVRDEDEALEWAREIGYPVVVKVVSRDVLHKSEVGGVILKISSDLELKDAYHKILENVRARAPDARVSGILVEEMVNEGVPVIIGMTRDPSFGPTVMFGLGGVFVEILRDVSFRVAPLLRQDAEEMIREIRGYPVLEGVRGGHRASREALVDVLLKISDLACRHPEIEQVDFNPVLASESEAKVVDARMILSG